MTELETAALRIRLATSEMLLKRGFGHLGGSFSMVEALAVLYYKQMRIDPKNPQWAKRDWFVLSKGHGGPAYYAALATRGFFPEAWLLTLNDNGTKLPSHPDRMKTPGVDCTTGSLGQGISQAAGVALALRMQQSDAYVYCLIGDGECNEGQIFEALQFIAHHQLSNLILLIDNNKKQLDGLTETISFAFDFVALLDAFGFQALSVDGHDVVAIDQAIETAKRTSQRPSCVILDTVKGYGIDYFAQLADNHHIRFSETERDILTQAIASMKAQLEATHEV